MSSKSKNTLGRLYNQLWQWRYFALATAFVVGFGLFLPDLAFAQDTPPFSRAVTLVRELFAGVTGAIIRVFTVNMGLLFGMLSWLFGVIVSQIFIPLAEMGLSVTASDLVSAGVRDGWEFVRNVVNMFFILALIVIGIATILRLENYNYRRLLATLVLMALLINFSLVISQAILEIADAATFTFLPTSNQEGVSQIRQLWRDLTQLHTPALLVVIFNEQNFQEIGTMGTDLLVNETKSLVTIIFKLIFTLMVGLTIGAIAVFLLIRMVALMILLVLSPAAYALAILPVTRQYASKWWSVFLKYALFLPIMAFFLRLALTLYNSALDSFPLLSDTIRLQQDWGERGFSAYLNYIIAQGQDSTSVTTGDLLALVTTFCAILAFLWGALLVTRSLSIHGASGILSVVQRGTKSPLLAGGAFAGRTAYGATDRYMARGAKEGMGTFRKALSFASPTVIRKAWNDFKKQRDEEAFGGATVQTGALIKSAASGGRTDYRDAKREYLAEQLNSDAKQFQDKESPDVQAGKLRAAVQRGDQNAMARALAMARSGDVKEMFEAVGVDPANPEAMDRFAEIMGDRFGDVAGNRLSALVSKAVHEKGFIQHAFAYTDEYNPQTGQTDYIRNPNAEDQRMRWIDKTSVSELAKVDHSALLNDELRNHVFKNIPANVREVNKFSRRKLAEYVMRDPVAAYRANPQAFALAINTFKDYSVADLRIIESQLAGNLAHITAQGVANGNGDFQEFLRNMYRTLNPQEQADFSRNASDTVRNWNIS